MALFPNQEVLQYSDWESDLHIHLNQILQTEIENYLLENNQVGTDELILPLPSHALTVQEVLNRWLQGIPQKVNIQSEF